MRILRKFPVLLLMVILAAACLLLGLKYYSGDQKPVRVRKEKDTFTVLAPRLDHCGDAFLLYNDQEAVLIDTGEKGDADIILEALRSRGIDKLKALILTHYDKDHIGGAPAILKAVPVKKCYMPLGTKDSDPFVALEDSLASSETEEVIVTEMLSFEALNASFTIYPPLTAEFEKHQDNNLSLITSVIAEGGKLLFTGDAENERMTQYVESQYDGTQYTWLKVPHHGRDKKTVKMLLDLFVPKEAVISSSEDEPEEEDVVRLLEKAGVSVLLTRKEDIEFQVKTAPPY